MVKLFCAIVGVAGSAIPVDIDASQTVGDLKGAIKEKKSNKLKNVDAGDLQIFLARTADGAWLESDSEDVKKLKEGEKTVAVEKLTSEKKDLQGKSGLQEVLVGMPKASTEQIHVLVVVPEGAFSLVSEASPLDQLGEKLDKLNDELNKTVLGKRKVCHSSASSSLLDDLHVRVRASRAGSIHY
ncbi:hypothetical protein PF010_g10595 [Phytophthora fragariae]|uniref:Crinkler effector protein N-terminal domain-containing protein n=1 Tax=Phytophthora fragariae TaxID=53985 RepID=A0A6G0L855_9STRA|nr:hypothetical protein PF010_g10595 [Phytophthora fragariae]